MGGGHLYRVHHRGFSVQPDIGDTCRPVTRTAKNRGFGATRPLHHGAAGGADAACIPQVVHNREAGPHGKCLGVGQRFGDQWGDGQGVNNRWVLNDIATRGEGLIKAVLTGFNHK